MKQQLDYYPIIVLPCIMDTNNISFLGATEKIEITGEWTTIVKTILEYCNGNYSISDIASLSGLDERIVTDIIKKLENSNAIVDSREQYLHFHRISSYPTTFLRVLSQSQISEHLVTPGIQCMSGEKFQGQRIKLGIECLVNNRRSCRSYSHNLLTIEQIITLCYAGYGQLDSNGRHTVPSGGALYPLKLYVIICKSQIGIPAGYYEYNPISNQLIRYNNIVDIEELKYCFNTEDFYGSSVQFVIAGDISRQGFKYSNRAYRLCLIEVGHVAENIALAAQEMGLGTCELGGLLDDAIHKELNMSDKVFSFLAMTVGYPSITDSIDLQDYSSFIEKNVGENKPVKDVHVWNDGGSFYTATAEYEDNGELCVGGATARSYLFAKYKAVIEAYERYESFAGKKHERMKNSCGIAAHFTFLEAQKAALAELIERDAIINCWNRKYSPPRISSLSVHLKRRTKFWKEQGRLLSVLLLESEYAPVVLVCITGKEYPYFVCGAASSVGVKGHQVVEFEKLQNKALLEAESSLLYYLRNPEHGEIPRVDNIYSPEDHGKLYRMDSTALDQIDWLTLGDSSADIIEWKYSFEELVDLLNINVLILDSLKNGLIVVKVTTPHLKEMEFGADKSSNKYPHFFA